MNKLLMAITALLVANLGLTSYLISSQIHLKHQIGQIKPTITYETVPVSLTCSGVLGLDLNGNSVPTNGATPETVLLGYNLHLSDSTPLNLSCH